MNYSNFISLVRRDGEAPGSVEGLDALLREYPWFQTARLLHAQELGDELSDSEKRLVAIYAGNRSQLRRLLKGNGHAAIRTAAKEVPPAIPRQHEYPLDIQKEERIFQNADANDAGIFAPEITGSIFVEPPQELEPEAFGAPAHPFIESLTDAGSSSLADPHEIIRRRLEEIFASKTTSGEVSGSNEPVITEKQPEKVQESRAEIGHREALPASTPLPDQTAPAISPPVNSGDAEEVLIRKEYMHLQDEVDREELAHAAEETIVHSLESLPIREESLSFSGWLKRTAVPPFGSWEEVHAPESGIIVIQSAGSAHEPASSVSPKQLIDRFIATDPRIAPSKAEFYSPAIQAKRSVEEDEDLVTETLANIYMEQGMLAKARQAYEKLSLLFPEKSSSFAALILKIDQSLNTEE